MPFAPCVSIGILLLPWFPCTWGKCIFDQVQRSIKVVSPPTGQYASAHWPLSETAINVPVTASEKNPALYSSKPQRSKRAEKHVESMAAPQPIRIKIWIPSESPALSDWERERLMTAVDEAVNEVSSLLSVRRVPDNLLLNRDINKYCKFIWRNSSTVNHMKCGRAKENYRFESCLGMNIPDEHLDGCAVYPHPEHPVPTVLRPEGTGVPDTDFLLYVFTHSTDKCRAESSLLAYAAHCQADPEGRPLAGTMVICREPLNLERYTHEHYVQTVIHELFHVLGFSKELLSQRKDCSVSSQAGVDCWSHGQVISTDEMGQVRLYSPTVIKAMQKHLNSTHTDLGAPLENKDVGSDGLSSHWEARVLQGSIMAALLVEPSLIRIDHITLAALQDTGWYSVNFSQAQSLVWGEGEGSQFGSLSTCHNSSTFFCTDSALGCHYLHLHKGKCLTDPYLDGCHIFKPLANASECWNKENERSGMNEGSGEIYGSDSRCFISNLTRPNHSSSRASVAGHCYRHRCTGRNKYQIQVRDSDWLDCPAGKSVEVSGYQGLVFCPDNRLCKYSDLAPPTSRQKADNLLNVGASIESDHDVKENDATPQPSLTPFSLVIVSKEEIVVAAVLSIMAAFSLLSSAVLIYRKCSSARVRVHAANEPPYRSPLSPIQCISRN
ncbi:ciliated left-right organizer metallopeptidase isoform X2 [Ctenopharyngodon idella]|uniref:ciliated left-right organizer metallopeptidase isoform X2 n=1 Tax=Ctenopharyngodon idella TaxID=7959 RepID=UPI00222EB1A0|nr:ciliated left-right organizer metallopeptidase isoform X2 [Ctenopharyngodon idella]